MKNLTKASVCKLSAGLGIALMSVLSLMPLTATAADSSYDLLKAADPELNKQYVKSAFGKIQNKKFNNGDRRKKLLLIGDSQAQDFLNSVLENDELAGYQIRTRHIPAQCQPYLGDPLKSGVEGKDQALCEKVESLAKAKSQIANADVIVIASLWRDWAVKSLPQTIENMQLRENQKLVIVGRKGFGRISLRHYLRMSGVKRAGLKNAINAKFLNENNLLKRSLPAHVFVDQYALVCGNGQKKCPVFTPSGELISFDGGHLTKEGAKFVGEKIFRSQALSDL